jgi:DNA-binding MarR family transcriptional regulator
MNRQEKRTLRILEAIETDPLPSQREMARQLNVSLGLVNAFIKRLTHKGYFKITTIPKNRLRYVLTPKGAAEKTRLTFLYIQHSLEYYRNARTLLRNLFHTLGGKGIGRVVFCGVSELTEIAYLSLKETSIRLVAVVDESPSKGHYLWGEVKPIEAVCNDGFDRILVTALEHRDMRIEQLLRLGVPRERIVTPEWPSVKGT